MLVLPYAYRAIDAGLSAIDVKTLAEAARSLGSNWFTVIVRVVLPNIRSAVLSAAFLTVALVLGEFTIASLLHRDQPAGGDQLPGQEQRHHVGGGVPGFAVLFAMSFVGAAPLLLPDR